MKRVVLSILIGTCLWACKKPEMITTEANDGNVKSLSSVSKLRLNSLSGSDSVLTVETYAGVTGTSGSANGSRLSATFFAPEGIVFDKQGNMIVADRDNNVIRKITPAGTVSVLAGAVGVAGLVDNTNPLTARFDSPIKVACDTAGNIYVADRDNARIRKISVVNNAVTTFAGTTQGSGTSQFNWPLDMAITANGTMYVADSRNNRIQKVTSAGVVSLLAGSSTNVAGNANGTGSAARFDNPSGVAIDNAGNILVADRNNNKLRKVTTAGVVTDKAGTGHGIPINDGPALDSRLDQPFDVKVRPDGSIYIAEIGSHSIRMLNANGLLTVAGNSASGFSNGDFSKFNTPTSIAFDSGGNMYVAEIGNQDIRKLVSTSRILYNNFNWTQTTVATGLTRYHFSGYFFLRDSSKFSVQNVNVLDVDLNNYKLFFQQETYANATTTSNMASHVSGAIAAVNGTFGDLYPSKDANGNPVSYGSHVSFHKNRGTVNWQVGSTAYPIDSTHLQWWKSDGALYYNDVTGIQGMIYGDANRYTTETYPNIVSGGPMLIYNYAKGRITFNHSTSAAVRNSSDHQSIDNNQGLTNPRTIVAIAPNNHLLMVTVDGRQAVANGFNSDEMTNFMQVYFNPQHALNLDGGGSTTMVINGQVVNIPSNTGGVQRATLTNAIVVIPKN